MSDLLKRLEVIKAAVELGDEDVIALQARRLPPEAGELSTLLDSKEYGKAAQWIEQYRQDNLTPAVYTDPEISALQLELKTLEDTLTTLAAEKAEMVARLAEFNAAYMEHVGPILGELLEAMTQHAESEDEAAQAQREYEEFQKARQEQPKIHHLDDDEKQELRQLYKKAAQKCHPDRVPEEQKEAATALFQQLEEAYRTQDIKRVREIWQQLEQGDWQAASDALAQRGDVAALRQRVAVTRGNVDALRAEIEAIRADETWQLILELERDGVEWEGYLSQQRTEMEKKLSSLKS